MLHHIPRASRCQGLWTKTLSVSRLKRSGFNHFQTHFPASRVFSSSKNKAFQEIRLDSVSDTITKLTLNRPHRANAIGRQMLNELQEAVSILSSPSSSNVRCVILTSSHDKIFSAGADLKERSKMTQTEASEFVKYLRNTMNALENLPISLIASVNGAALGGGLEIALTSDIIVASKDSSFGAPETSIGIIPGAGGSQRLPRLIGKARAKELIFSARRIDANTAYEYGLVQYVEDCSDEKAIELAHEIAENAPIALRAAKEAINNGLQVSSLNDAMEIEKKNYEKVLSTEDRLEGLAAFREKRQPEFQGK